MDQALGYRYLRLLGHMGVSVCCDLVGIWEERLSHLPLPCIRVAGDLKIDELGVGVNLLD